MSNPTKMKQNGTGPRARSESAEWRRAERANKEDGREGQPKATQSRGQPKGGTHGHTKKPSLAGRDTHGCTQNKEVRREAC
jgi:hypothetical protein